jgi:hypothetical protein
MRQKWGAAGTLDPAECIAKERRRNRQNFMIALAGLLVSLALAVTPLFPFFAQPEADMTRNAYGGATKRIDTEVTAEYGGESVKKRVSVGVLPAEANAAEIRRRIDDLKQRLPALILGRNEKLSDVRYDLDLIGHDAESGADIVWSSDNEKAVTPDGTVNHIEGRKGDRVGLSAMIRLGEASERIELNLFVGDPPGDYAYAGDIGETIDSVVDEVSNGSAGNEAVLPAGTAGGVKLDWAAPSNRTILFAPVVFLIFGFIVYRRRYAGIDREIAAARESVERDFPDFLDKLLLLLNAGIVITSAISKIADDYRERRESVGERYFYEELCRMEDRIRSSRVSLMSEFSELAKRSGRREVMRFSAILADNIDKGSALGEKLSQESDMLWDMRKKSAEKAGRIAETKLTFPMVLQLVVIILITVAPAVIEMK